MHQSGQSAALPGSDLKVLLAPVPWPNQTDGPVPGTTLNPWHYISNHPTNNAGNFDLWAEFVDGKKVKIVCNWTREILESRKRGAANGSLLNGQGAE